jgi:hypothetical protein
MPATVDLYVPNTDYLFANRMTILELGGQERYIELTGSGMPHVGAAWGVRQNAPITWFPGNQEGSQQVLGGQVLPSDWEGTWKRTLLSKAGCKMGQLGSATVSVILPETLVAMFESICLSGIRVRVKWRNYTREGRLSEFTHTHDKTTDVTWKAKFDWINRGHVSSKRVQGIRSGTVTSDLDAAALEAELAANLDPTRLLVSQRPEKIPKGTPKLTLGQIGMMLNAPNKLMSNFSRSCRAFTKNLQQISALVNQARSLPASLANTILNEEENMLAIINTAVDSMSRQTPEQLSVERNAAAVARNASYFGSGIRQAQVLAGKCADMRRNAQNASAEASGSGIGNNKSTLQSGDVLHIHMVKQGETLVSISFDHYGSPDHAYDIAQCNHLPYPCPPDATGLSIGGKRTLVIPVLKGKGA